jgi:hypothetical protein
MNALIDKLIDIAFNEYLSGKISDPEYVKICCALGELKYRKAI